MSHRIQSREAPNQFLKNIELLELELILQNLAKIDLIPMVIVLVRNQIILAQSQKLQRQDPAEQVKLNHLILTLLILIQEEIIAIIHLIKGVLTQNQHSLHRGKADHLLITTIADHR